METQTRTITTQSDFPMKKHDVIKVKHPNGGWAFYHLTGEVFKQPNSSKVQHKADVRTYTPRVPGRNSQG